MATATIPLKGSASMESKKVSISSKRQITIPQKFFTLLGFNTEAECIMRGNELVLRPVKENTSGEFAEQVLADVADFLPGGVAAEQDTDGAVNGGLQEGVANQSHDVGVEGLNVVQSPDRSGNSADSVDKASATVDVGHFVLCDNRVVCRHHHNELLPSNE